MLDADGTPARGFQIRADGADRGPTPLTRNDGRFFLPQVQNGAISVFVYPPKVGEGWGPFPARGGDGHLVVRISEGAREKREFDVPPKEHLDSLAGQIAPGIRAARWNGQPTPLSSLRGQVVLLFFGAFTFNRNSPVEDFARSFSRRVAVVGVDLNLSVQLAKQWDKFAREMPSPVALDARSSTPRTMGGQTWALYKGAQYVVIGRDGKIVYAGNEFDRAITFAASASK